MARSPIGVAGACVLLLPNPLILVNSVLLFVWLFEREKVISRVPFEWEWLTISSRRSMTAESKSTEGLTAMRHPVIIGDRGSSFMMSITMIYYFID